MSTSICGAIRDFCAHLGIEYHGIVVHRCQKLEGHKGQHYSPQLVDRTGGGPYYWTGDDRKEPKA